VYGFNIHIKRGQSTLIEVNNLVKKYGDHLAVDDITFTIEDNLIYGFLGPNGAGKSTTMNIMTGYIGFTSGEVLINGHDILAEPEKAKRCIGYLPELPPLYKNMTVDEYLVFAAELKAVPKSKRKEEIEKAIESTSLSDVRHRLINNLSKGYKQRVGLAQALIGSPEIIILDEPTVGLDPKQIIEIRDLIRTLGKNHTVLLSSHILSEVQEVCDKVLIIHHGKLIAEGTPEELKQHLGSQIIEVSVKTNSDADLEKMFAAIENVSAVELSPVNNGEVTIKLTTPAESNIQEAIYNTCVRAGLPITMLKTSEFSLEQIFLELTEKDDAMHEAEDQNDNNSEADAEVLEKEENE